MRITREDVDEAVEMVKRFRSKFGRMPVDGDIEDIDRLMELQTPAERKALEERLKRRYLGDIVDDCIIRGVQAGTVEIRGVSASGDMVIGRAGGDADA